MALPLPFITPPEGRWFEESDFASLRSPPRVRLLAFLSRKTNDIPRTAGKVKPAANAAFLGVLAFLELFDFGCGYLTTKNAPKGPSRWRADAISQPGTAKASDRHPAGIAGDRRQKTRDSC
jgi:hypothetical protein